MAKIVHCLKSLGIGGTEKTAQYFCEYLIKYTKHDVHLVYNTDNDCTRLSLFKEFLRPDQIHGMNGERGCEVMLNLLKPDIVHLYRSGEPTWPHPNDKSLYVETNVFGQFDPNLNLRASFYMSEWLLEAVKNSQVGPWLKNSGRKLDFVFNPVKPPVTDEKLNLNLPDDTVVLGRNGRPDNGVYDSLNVKAAWILHNRGLKIHFLVMAAPPNMLKDLAELGVPYTALSPTTDEVQLSRFYNTIDVLAHARPDGESAGSNLFEAAYHGKPIVSHVAVPQYEGMGVFQNQTMMADYVARHDVQDYARCLEALVIDKERRERLGRNQRIRAEEAFDWKVCGAKLDRLYGELLNG